MHHLSYKAGNVSTALPTATKSSRNLSATPIVFGACSDTTPLTVWNVPNARIARRKVRECSV